MSLTSKIIFATSMLLCAALCAWAGLAFGGPGAPVMWGLTGLCVVVSVVVLLIKGPGREGLEDFRVAGAREPTFRLVRSETKAQGEIWQLVLGRWECALIRPDGTRATTFARKWAETAIKLPGFTRGDLLGIVTEDWSPPDENRGITAGELFQAATTIHRAGDRDTRYYWFAPTKDLIREIEDYQSRTRAELGPEAVGPLLIKARQVMLSGALGLAAGIALFVYGIMGLTGQDDGQPIRRLRPIVLGAVIALFGLWRLGRGIVMHTQARQFS